MLQVDAAHARRWQRREVLRQLHADRIGAEQLEQPRLLRVIRAGWVAEGGPDAAVPLADQVFVAAPLLLVAPVEARTLVQLLRERLGESVGKGLRHDRRV